ncbi:uncharacterized protein CC84DRAFT_1221136 [Paraphaeosphaeria sporulosa]|uniref:SGNH hydrolase-type esterase domain-containing protein n=1 Tax=Paraphaeosphaeria sporulosa TaxID=1460663 RepID=A0A177C426_9PLEO|nr:uncharacterized protein CC84DRAFT_1221136 [Paraphaeosphaeria sporulosa]OAG01649.1 hypothetical protein CC84DRAFT_1221136 [Paraphaeosphaeria sporulosa]
MSDNENEGHPGARVDQVALFARNDVAFKPNLTLINAGTNDVIREASEYPIDKIGERMYKLIEFLFGEIPDERQARIILADLHPVIKAEELVDGTLPNDKDYEKLAEAWVQAIAEAGRKGILLKPQDPGDPNINVPPKDASLVSSASSRTSGYTHKATLATPPVALAPISKALSTNMHTKAFPTPEVACSLPMNSEPLEAGVGSRLDCTVLGKAPAYLSQTLIPVLPQSHAARSNKPF